MCEMSTISDKKKVDGKLLDFVHELVMLNFVYEQKIVTEEERQMIRKELMRKYGIKGSII